MSKIRLLFFLFLLAYGTIIVRLFYLQVLHPITSTDYLQTKKIPPERGNIFDRNGQPLVTNQIKYQLYIEPKYVTDEEILKIKLARELGVEEASISAKLDKTKDWVAIASGIAGEKHDTIQAL